MNDDPQDVTPDLLHNTYGVDLGEADRLIAIFGGDSHELERLLTGRNRTPAHRRREMATPEDAAAFGLR